MTFLTAFKKVIVGFSYGVSFPLTVVILDYWLKDCGVSNTTVGLFSVFHLPFALKLFFAPIIDKSELPFFSKFFGRRRGWVVFSQLFLIVAVLCMAQMNPKTNIILLMSFASLVALADGFQNVALYPYQICDITKNQFGYVAGLISFGHRIGGIFVKVATLYCAHYFGWKIAYECAALIVFLCMISVFFMENPKIIADIHTFDKKSVHGLSSPLNELSSGIKKIINSSNGIYTILILLLYKATDYTIQKMSRAFCLEIGFSKLEIANIVQFFGSVAVVVGGFFAGFIISRFGVLRAMIYLAVLHMFSIFFYALLYYVGNDSDILCATIFAEGLSGGAVSAAFIAFLYENCKNGSQYAVFWAVHELGAMCFRFSSGFLADCLGWGRFFIFAPLLSIPCILILLKIDGRHQKSV